MLTLTIECEDTQSSVYKTNGSLRITLKNVDEDQLIGEILDNIEIEKLLMQIDPETLQNELKRKIDEY